VTDLNQGVVYGVDTDEIRLDPRLHTRFDYDVFARCSLVQALLECRRSRMDKEAKRGLRISVDTLGVCVELALLHPPMAGEYRVFNQFTEQFSCAGAGPACANGGPHIGLDAEQLFPTHAEREEHYYNAANTRLHRPGPFNLNYLNVTIPARIGDGDCAAVLAPRQGRR